MAYTKEASVFQVTQLGVESTPGTSVPCNRRMPSLAIAHALAAEVKEYRAQGSKVTGVAALNKEWSTFKYDGNGGYGELPYIFASVLTNHNMGPSAGVWTFQPAASSPDTPQTYTMQHGSTTYATQIVNALFSDCTISATRDEFKVSGNGLGKLLTPGITLTANPTLVDKTPITANQISIFYDTSFGALGTTQLKAAYSWELAISGRWGPNWVLDATQTSWKDSVELVPTIGLKMKLMRNSDADAFITQMRGNATNYLMFNALGPGGDSLVISMPVVAINPSEPEDLAGVYVVEWTLKPILDSAFMAAKNNAFLETLVINGGTGL